MDAIVVFVIVTVVRPAKYNPPPFDPLFKALFPSTNPPNIVKEPADWYTPPPPGSPDATLPIIFVSFKIRVVQ